jgi:hypothetical protein
MRLNLTQIRAENGAFFIPYFLTFDRGLAELYDTYPQGSCLFGEELVPPLFFAMMDLPDMILSKHPHIFPLVDKVFGETGEAERQYRRAMHEPDMSRIIADLEPRLAAFQK